MTAGHSMYGVATKARAGDMICDVAGGLNNNLAVSVLLSNYESLEKQVKYTFF
jgi:hypothetical protein